jgi:hypothetical protein
MAAILADLSAGSYGEKIALIQIDSRFMANLMANLTA